MKKKCIFIGGTVICASALLATIVGAGHHNLFKAGATLDPYKLDLVQELQGKTITDGLVSFEKRGYSFSFLVDGVSVSAGSISIADGGFIKNATAFNGLESISLTGSYANALLSSGTLSEMVVLKNEDRAAASSVNALTGDTHFRLDAEGGSVSFSKLELAYQCGTTVETDSSSSWDVAWGFHGQGTEANPILINSLADWNRFATYSENDTFAGKYIALTTDIDASASTNLLKIAFDSDNSDREHHLFNGHFDGRGHTINYDVSVSTLRKGLFCRTGDAEIKNLNVEGTFYGTDVIGALVGENFGATTISNCISRVDIQSGGTPTSSAGILGLNAPTKNSLLRISGCEFSGTVSATALTNFGGIIGNINTSKATTLIENCVNHTAISSTKSGVGGIVGRMCAGSTTTINDCVNDSAASISSSYVPPSASDNPCVGGIAGKALGTSTFNNCLNLANIVASDSTGISSVGGIVGFVENNAYTYVFNKCENRGDVTGSRFIGGIIGRNENLTGTVRVNYCVNKGTITGTHTNAGSKAGGIIGGSGSGTESLYTAITGCVNFGHVTSGSVNANTAVLIGGIVGSLGNFAKVSECVNYGPVDTKGAKIGGIAGEVLRVAEIENCDNYGQITGAKFRVGGISGDITDGARVRHCTNFGNVTGTGAQSGGVGGITGIYFPNIYSSTYYPEFTHNINYGTIVSNDKFAGGLVGKAGNANLYGPIQDSINYGNVSSTNNVHGGLVGADSSSGTSGLKLNIVNSVSYGNSSGASDNFAVGKAHLGALTSSLASGSVLTVEVALEPNSWTLSSGESYCAIVSKGGSETFVNLTQDGSLYKYNADLSLYDNIEFAVLNSGKTIADGREGVKLSTPSLRLGSGHVYSIDSVSTEATGHWKEASNMIEVSIDASSWDAGTGYFAAQCLGGLNNEHWYQMTYDSVDEVYKVQVDAGMYHQVRFVLMNNGASLTQDETTNLANSSLKSVFIGVHSYKTLVYSKLGEYNSDAMGCWQSY